MTFIYDFFAEILQFFKNLLKIKIEMMKTPKFIDILNFTVRDFYEN